MDINENLIRHVAMIARLNLTDKEIKEFTPQLKEVIEAFSRLSEVNTENTTPSFQPIRIRNRTRDDIKGKCLSQEEALKNTVHKKDGYFKGPRAI